jgi:hypothetical protein
MSDQGHRICLVVHAKDKREIGYFCFTVTCEQGKKFHKGTKLQDDLVERLDVRLSEVYNYTSFFRVPHTT